MERLETSDIYRGATLLCLGATLEKVNHHSSNVTFVLRGETLKTDDMNYRLGKARINPLQLRETLNVLRDLIFNKPERAHQ